MQIRDKPILGYFEAFINPKEIVTKGEGTDDATHELRFAIQDELYIAPEPWNPKNVEVHFDGGQVKIKREDFLELVKDYEQTYQRDIHHSAIAELEKAVDSLPNEKAQQFKAVLHSMQKQLDAKREGK